MTTTTTITNTGADVRSRRRAAGITQRELAVEASCSIGSVANLEAGVVPRRSEVLDRILEALGRVENRPLAA